MPTLPFYLALLVLSANAIRVPFEIRFSDDGPHTSLTRRAPTPISNTGNAQYVTNITLGGVTLPVLLDTGRSAQSPVFFFGFILISQISSSDLWASFPTSNQPSLTNLNKAVSLNYAVGKVAGL